MIKIFEVSNKNLNFGKHTPWAWWDHWYLILTNLTNVCWRVKCVNIVKICIVNHYFPNFQCPVLQKSCSSARSIQNTQRPVDFNVRGCKKIHWHDFRFHIITNILKNYHLSKLWRSIKKEYPQWSEKTVKIPLNCVIFSTIYI